MRNNFDKYEKVLVDSFYESYDIEQLPDWVKRKIDFQFYPDRDKKVLRLTVFINKILPLKEGFYYEEQKGDKQLMYKDPLSGEKKVVISSHNLEIFPLFVAELDKNMLINIIEKKTDLDSLNEADFFKYGVE
jgi:hypothetical protein